MDKKEEKAKKEFTPIEVPNSMADKEEKELVELINKVTELAIKKGWSLILMTCSKERKHNISIFEGCAHCLSIILKKSLDQTSELLQMLLHAIATHMQGIEFEEENIIRFAKKNTPQGN